MFVHLTLVPYIATAGELKTKPTQHSVKEMLSIGIQPDVLICRSDRQLGADLKAKIALFCNVAEVVRHFRAGRGQHLRSSHVAGGRRTRRADFAPAALEAPPRDLSRWLAMLETLENPQGEVRIGVVGKYVQLEDAYKSLREALVHGGLANRQRVVIEWIEAEDIDSPATAERLLRHVDGILVPGGFGKRGIQGMVHAITYAREKKCRSSAFAWACSARRSNTRGRFRSSIDADSTEFDPSTPNRVIYKLRELLGVDEMGGTMRLGAWPCKLEPGSFAAKAYGSHEISERHRHRYEFNCEYEETLTRAGFRITGRTPDGVYVEIVEAAGPPLVPGLPVSSGVQIEAARAAPAIRGVRSREPGEPPPAPRCRLRKTRLRVRTSCGLAIRQDSTFYPGPAETNTSLLTY